MRKGTARLVELASAVRITELNRTESYDARGKHGEVWTCRAEELADDELLDDANLENQVASGHASNATWMRRKPC